VTFGALAASSWSHYAAPFPPKGIIMRRVRSLLFIGLVSAFAAPALAADAPDAHAHADKVATPAVKALKVETSGSVSIEGSKLEYKAIAGTILLTGHDEDKNDPTASIFYTAYLSRVWTARVVH
jgi:hypothetical protein